VRRFPLVAVLVVVAAVGAACSGSGGLVKVKDPGRIPNITTTTAVDFGQIGLKGVSSRTTTSVAMGPGNATLAGAVQGPDGPVEGATVRIERLVGSSAASTDLTTLADGTWSLPMVLGGRYRLRAWRAPELALTKPELVYVQSSETKAVNLRVDRYSGAAATASVAPNPPIVGQQANLYVLLAQRTVDPAGVVRNTPVPNAAIELVGSGFQLESQTQTVTDGNGIAQWRVRCTTTGSTSMSITGPSGGSLPLTLPACLAEGTSSETTSSSSSTTVRRTTSTRRGV